MNNQIDTPLREQTSAHTPVSNEPAPAPEGGKRPFVEPEVSVPVDVLEATSFFQAATNGVVIP